MNHLLILSYGFLPYEVYKEMFEAIFSGPPENFDFSRMEGGPAVEKTCIADYVWLPLRFVEPCEEYPHGMVLIDWLDEWRIEDYE